MIPLFAAVLTAALQQPSLAALPLVGVWEPTTRSRGDMGVALEFCADGSLVATTAAMVDFEYRTEGLDRLVLIYTERTTGQRIEQPFTIRFEEDGAMVQESGASRSRLTRAEPPSSASRVVGLWTDVRFGKTAYTRYFVDGRGTLRVISRRDAGRFRVEGDRVTLELAGRPPVTYRFEVDGDNLDFESPFGEKGIYRRGSGL